jgi:hypothetical protein
MIELGNKSQVSGAEHWPTFYLYRRPKKMPKVPRGHTIVCGFEEEGTEGERMFICETLEQVHVFYNESAKDRAVHISWYHTDALNAAIVVV